MKRKVSPGVVIRFGWIAVDTVLFSLLVSAPFMLLFRMRKHSFYYIMFFAAVICFVLIIQFLSQKHHKRIKKEEEEREAGIEQILLMDDAVLKEAIGENDFFLIRKLRPDKCDVLDAIRSGAKSIGLLVKDQAFTRILSKYAPERKVIDVDMIMDCVFGRKGKENKEVKPNRILCAIRSANKYFLLGCVLLFLSFIAGYKIYFRLISALCMILAVMTGLFRNSFLWKNLRIFLDKKEYR